MFVYVVLRFSIPLIPAGTVVEQVTKTKNNSNQKCFGSKTLCM